jgi:gluconolactonase
VYEGGRIERIDLKTGDVTVLYNECDGRRFNGPNDIVFDRTGGFYFTDFGKPHPQYMMHGAVYYARPDGSMVREVAFPMQRPNGIGLSPDEKTLYVAETSTCYVWSFDISEPGTLQKHPRRAAPHGGRFLLGLGGLQQFDSLAVDAAGNICVATLVSGAITVITPFGDVIRQIETGDEMTTNICFAGADMRDAYITLASRGEVVKTRWPSSGLRLNFSI